MSFLFSFEGKLPRLPYALWTFLLLSSQHVIAFAASAATGRLRELNGWFYVVPLRWLVTNVWSDSERALSVSAISVLAYWLVLVWALAALAFRRAADADLNEWNAAYVIAPIVQIPVILFLCLYPSRDAGRRPPHPEDTVAAKRNWASTQGVLVGVAMTLFAVASGALIFGVYQFGIFVISPFVIGAMTAYFANRTGDIGPKRTASVVIGAMALGGVALAGAALEGIVCIVMAIPLGLATGLIGGFLGRAIASRTKRSPGQTLRGIALLPVVFGLEAFLPVSVQFDTYQTIEVQAPPEVVWKSIVQMDSIDEPLTLPFRLGVAYPLRGEIVGEGVGALRHGVFSTGTALERITEWIPDRKIAFVVLTDVPALRELSPYSQLHAPHVLGYFRTRSTSFELVRRSADRTEIIERGSHELRLEPVLYWLPLARWVLRENNTRVLTHIRKHAERNFRTGR